jgi:hypothetical protein
MQIEQDYRSNKERDPFPLYEDLNFEISLTRRV